MRTYENALLSTKELARFLSVSVRTIHRLRSAGKLPRPLRIGESVRWRRDEIMVWLAEGAPHLDKWENQRGPNWKP